MPLRNIFKLTLLILLFPICSFSKQKKEVIKNKITELVITFDSKDTAPEDIDMILDEIDESFDIKDVQINKTSEHYPVTQTNSLKN